MCLFEISDFPSFNQSLIGTFFDVLDLMVRKIVLAGNTISTRWKISQSKVDEFGTGVPFGKNVPSYDDGAVVSVSQIRDLFEGSSHGLIPIGFC